MDWQMFGVQTAKPDTTVENIIIYVQSVRFVLARLSANDQ